MKNSFFKIFAFASFFWLFESAVAAQWAAVSAEKAIIYADIEMTSPIGYAVKDKMIRVGEVTRNKGRVIPFVLNDRIVYIQVADVKFSGRGDQGKQDALNQFKRFYQLGDTKQTQAKIGVKGRRFNTSVLTTEEGAAEDLSFTGFGVKSYFENFLEGHAFAGEFEYLQANLDSNTFTFYLLHGEYHYRFIQFEGFKMSLFGGLSFAPVTQFESEPLFTVNSPAFGAVAGAEIYSKILPNWGLHFNAGYQYLRVLGYDIPDSDTVHLPSRFTPSFKGATMGAMLSRTF